MAEPTSTVATSVAFGAGAFVMAAFGVEAQTLVASLVGATIGVSLAPPTSKFRAVVLFFAVVIACAIIGTFGADQLFGGNRVARNFSATVAGMVFHPFFASAINGIPDLFALVKGWISAKVSK